MRSFIDDSSTWTTRWRSLPQLGRPLDASPLSCLPPFGYTAIWNSSGRLPIRRVLHTLRLMAFLGHLNRIQILLSETCWYLRETVFAKHYTCRLVRYLRYMILLWVNQLCNETARFFQKVRLYEMLSIVNLTFESTETRRRPASSR